MKNSKRLFIGIELILGIIFLVLTVMMLADQDRDLLGKVSVIVSDSDDSSWAAFRYGLRMAAEDRGIEVMIVGTEGVLTLEEEQKLIENEIARGADGIIVQAASGTGVLDMLDAAAGRIPVMLVGRPAPEEGADRDFPVTETDDYELGAMLAGELLADYSGSLSGKSVGILSRSTDLGPTMRRMRGFWETIRDSGAHVQWSVAGNFDGGTDDHLKNQPQVDIVAALDDYSLRAAGACSLAGGLHGARVYGVGHSTESVYYLDKGAVECLAVPDEFNAGYQSMSEIADCLEHYFYRARSQSVSCTVMRRETLFSEENQKILFTMSQ